MMLQHGHWEAQNWTLIQPEELATTKESIILRGFKLVPYIFRGEFQGDTCRIVDYSVDMMKACLKKASPWHLIGDSRTRVLFRGLNARLEQTLINDHRVHGTL